MGGGTEAPLLRSCACGSEGPGSARARVGHSKSLVKLTREKETDPAILSDCERLRPSEIRNGPGLVSSSNLGDRRVLEAVESCMPGRQDLRRCRLPRPYPKSKTNPTLKPCVSSAVHSLGQSTFPCFGVAEARGIWCPGRPRPFRGGCPKTKHVSAQVQLST